MLPPPGSAAPPAPATCGTTTHAFLDRIPFQRPWQPSLRPPKVHVAVLSGAAECWQQLFALHGAGKPHPVALDGVARMRLRREELHARLQQLEVG